MHIFARSGVLEPDDHCQHCSGGPDGARDGPRGRDPVPQGRVELQQRFHPGGHG